MRSLPVGARIWVNVPGTGFVGVGTVLAPAQRFEEARVMIEGAEVALDDQPLSGTYTHQGDDVDENAEWVVPVEWTKTVPERDACWEKGMFASQHSACKLRQEFTLDRLAEHFGIHDDE
jgi:hypothetical protein